MDHLQRLFASAVAEQVSRMESALAGLRAGTPGAETSLRQLAHAVRGSGASCGFPRVTELAEAAESTPRQELHTAIELLLAEMRTMATASSRKHVLIIDDDPLISRLLEMRLASPNRHIQSVESLAAARRVLEEVNPDAILLDLFLPDGDGRNLLADLREREDTATLPIIVISAATGATVQMECEALGADGYVAKPFDPDAVASLVAAVLERNNDPGRSNGRETLMGAFRRLLSAGHPITVTAVLPETHGPGGRRSEGPDPKVAPFIRDMIAASLPPRAVLGEWAEGEPGIVAHAGADVATALERARLRLRNRPHPVVPGAIASFSAAIVRDDGSGGMADAYARARQFALDANRSGGDKVITPAPMPRTRRVLVAGSDTLTAAMIISRLDQDGFEVEHHPDGVSALEASEQSDFGLVVIDLNLPDIDGFEVLDRLRKTNRLREVPIVVVAAVGSERDVARGFELGADDYLLKPFTVGELTTRLRRFTRQ